MSELIKFLRPVEYYDEENGFYALFVDGMGPQYISSEGKWLLDHANDSSDFNELVESYKGQFAIQSEEASSLIFRFLQNMQDVGLILFDDTFFMSQSASTGIHVVGEREYASVGLLIRNALHTDACLYSYSSNKRLFSDLAIRSKGFHNKENYFVQYAVDGKIENIIGIQNFDNSRMPAVVCLIQAFNGIESFLSFYREIEKILIKYKQYKVRLVFTNDVSNDIMSMFLLSAGFFKEAKMIRENGVDDIVFYSKMLGGE